MIIMNIQISVLIQLHLFCYEYNYIIFFNLSTSAGSIIVVYYSVHIIVE